jgi:glucans biosynthesis protein C
MTPKVPSTKCDVSERIWFMDALRFWLVLMVILLHSAASQTNYLWPVQNPRASNCALWFILLLAAFVMPSLFFVAGYFALPSLTSRGPWTFVKAKFNRLVIPALLVMVFLNPVHRYIHHHTHGFPQGVPRGYFDYWLHFLGSVTWFQRGSLMDFEFSWLHLWFVNVLFVFFAITALVWLVRNRSSALPVVRCREPASKRSIQWTLIGAGVAAWIAATMMDCFLPAFEWYGFLSWLTFEVPQIVAYIVYFCLGILAYRQGWFMHPKPFIAIWRWAAVAVVATVLMIWFGELWITYAELGQTVPFLSIFWFIHSVVFVSYFIVLVTIAGRYFNHRSIVYQHLAANSYRMYLLHFIVLVPVQLASLQWLVLPKGAVFIAVSAIAVVGTYLLSVFVGCVFQIPAWCQAAWTAKARADR